MLKFKKVEDKDIRFLQKFTQDSPYLLCDYSAGVIYMWKHYLKHEYAILNDTLIIKTGETNPRFFKPIGKNVEDAYNEIENYCVQKEIPLTFVCVEDDDLNFFKNRYEDKILISFNRDYSDYLYLVDEIKTFQGKKFSGQRNHINAFKRENPNYKYKKITKSDLPKLVKFLSKYKKQHQNMKGVEKSEFLNTISLTKKFFDYNFVGGYIEVDGEIVSMAIGEYCGQVMIIHVEKALVEYRGVYPTTFNEFVKNNLKDGVIYINREDDAGDLGLRTSKTQYKPVFLKNKYKITIDKKMGITTHPTLKGEKVILNKITKKDSKNYFKLYTQVKNNKYWGYDYKKDVKNIDENTFYLLQKKDFKNKSNLCLAIRKKGNTELIGEVVLYNFDYKNNVEVGIRLFKKEQKKGYAKESLALIENYVEKVLKLNLVAKCFKKNLSSKMLFLSKNFKIYKEDDKYFYFKKTE